MQSYPTTPAESKPAVTPAVAPGSWSLTARLARTWARNPNFARGAGSRRRARMEYRLVAATAWLRPLLRGELLDVGPVALSYERACSVAEQLRAQLGHYGPSSARLRQLVALVVSTGPGRGWAFTDHRAGGPRGSLFVRCYLPRRSEPAARAWLRLVRELRALLARVGRLASGVIPALRTAPTSQRGETVWRDHQSAAGAGPAWLEGIRARRCPDGAM